ncbi:hypothetical protein Q8A67_003667 [Cirrhinus molitorella]|uniref:Uncharacterized protein n=1 Tax=Cirrhinus molitorella TaxID=172907 RepID=A0AA88TUP9_9TELE|nr:hypothetical protein Q8A67_003667 [Cirrhinus molitorella]
MCISMETNDSSWNAFYLAFLYQEARCPIKARSFLGRETTLLFITCFGRLGKLKSEERFDTRRTVALRRPLPHQFSHYFETTYYSSYKKDDVQPIYTNPKKESRSFPGHQPELDPPYTKCVPNSCYRLDFKGPQHREEIVGETSEPQCRSVVETNRSL